MTVQKFTYSCLSIHIKDTLIFSEDALKHVRVMFRACRPAVRTCAHGHVVEMDEDECEEGHQVVSDQGQERGLLANFMEVIR